MCCCDNKTHLQTHCHEHQHDHQHSHHNCCNDENVSKEEKTLKVLLVHWINHNKSHQDNFLEWVEKCESMHKEDVGTYIKKAVEYMEKANEMLIEAKKHM